MDSFFLLQHLNRHADGSEETKIIGIYRTRELAVAAIDRMKTQPGFREFPKLLDPTTDDEDRGFYVDSYELGKDHWTEGFVTITHP